MNTLKMGRLTAEIADDAEKKGNGLVRTLIRANQRFGRDREVSG